MSGESKKEVQSAGPTILSRRSADPKELKIKRYDFKRPDKFSKDQIRTIAIMHETLARLTTTSLSAQLRCLSHMRLAAVDQLTYEEFIRSVPNPTTIGIVKMRPLKGSAVLEIDPAIYFAIIDRIFGGQGTAQAPQRDLTNVESDVMRVVIERLLANLGEAWSVILDLKPELGQIETNPQFAQILPPTEMVVLVTIEARIGEATGMINLCIPYITIEPIVPKLSILYMYSTVRRGRVVTPPGYGTELPVDSEICVDAGTHTLAAFGALEKGSMILLDEWNEGNAFVRSGGVRAINLRIDEVSRRSYKFTVNNTAISAMERSVITGIDKTEITKEMDARIKEPVSVLKQELQVGFEQLQNRIDEIVNRQDELSDHVYLSDDDAQSRMSHSGDRSIRPAEGPFGFIRPDDGESLNFFLTGEHPQLIALVLTNVEPSIASFVIQRLDPDLQIDVTERIYRMGRVSSQVVNIVKRAIEVKYSQLAETEQLDAGGYARAVEILNLVSRSTEKHIIEALEDRAPEMSEDIKQHMFVFEDIVLLDDGAVAAVVAEADRNDLVLALKGVESEVSAKVMGNANPEARVHIEKSIADMGPARLSDVEAAQQRIVMVIRQLESEGVIHVARAGEDLVVD